MKFDDMLVEFGEFGRYQAQVFAMVFIIAVPTSMHHMAQVFLAGETDHWCDVAGWRAEDCSQWGYSAEMCAEAKRNASSPVNGTKDALQCQKYELVDDLRFHPGLYPTNYNDTTLISCNDGWVYDRSQYKSSITQEFDLVCDHDHLNSFSQSLYFVGVLIGSAVSGVISDVFGRKLALFLCLFVQMIFGVVTAFSPSYWAFVFIRVVVAIANTGVFLLAFILGSEYVGPKVRPMAGMGVHISFSTGYMLLAVIAFYIRDWWILQLVISAPIALFFIFFPFLPESVRWLLYKGRAEEATTILKKAARVNKKTLPSPIFTPAELKEYETLQTARRATAVDLYRTPNLRFRTIVFSFIWFVNSLVYYGLSLSMTKLGINAYLAFFIGGAVEIPAVLISHSFMESDSIGRKWTTFIFMVFNGMCCVCTTFTPQGTWRTIITMLGKFGIMGSFAVLFTYTTEMFPTPIRSLGVGISSMWGHVGSIIAPLILLLSEYWDILPVIIFGISAIVMGFFILFLPETHGKVLPQTVAEGELFGTKRERTGSIRSISASGDTEIKTDLDHVPRASRSMNHDNPAFDHAAVIAGGKAVFQGDEDPDIDNDADIDLSYTEMIHHDHPQKKKKRGAVMEDEDSDVDEDRQDNPSNDQDFKVDIDPDNEKAT